MSEEYLNYNYKMPVNKGKQETILEQIDQNNPVTRGSTALVYKQETLEEAAENYTKDGTKHYMEKTNVELGFIAGAKWQQERMYSEEEVIAIVEKSRETGLTAEYLLLTEQFKKK